MKEPKKYIVKVQYMKFAFTDAEEAMTFAQTAMQTCTEDVPVSIIFVGDDE